MLVSCSPLIACFDAPGLQAAQKERAALKAEAERVAMDRKEQAARKAEAERVAMDRKEQAARKAEAELLAMLDGESAASTAKAAKARRKQEKRQRQQQAKREAAEAAGAAEAAEATAKAKVKAQLGDADSRLEPMPNPVPESPRGTVAEPIKAPITAGTGVVAEPSAAKKKKKKKKGKQKTAPDQHSPQASLVFLSVYARHWVAVLC